MATFSETSAFTSRIYLANRYEPSKIIQKTKVTLAALLRFYFTKALKTINFQGFYLPEKEPLVITLGETRALTFRKYVAEEGRTFQNHAKNIILLLSHSILIANGFYFSKGSFIGYFQLNFQ